MSRNTWTDAALEALAAGGIEAVRVESLAKKLAVTKGSFYWHFSDRRDLREAVLERWEERATSQIIEQVERQQPDDPRSQLRALIQAVFRAGPMGYRIENEIRNWAAADELAAQAVKRVDRRRLDYVVGLLRPMGHSPASARRRARLLYRAMIGEFLWRTSGGPSGTRGDMDDLIDLVTTVKEQ